MSFWCVLLVRPLMEIGRGQAALNKNETIEEGLKGEESFFNGMEPWRNIEDKSLLGTKNLRVKLAQLQMDMIRSSFKGITRDLKNKQEEAMKEYKLLGEIPSILSEKRALLRGIKDHIWKSIGTNVLSGHIDSLRGSSDMRPSAKFLDASQRYQNSLNSSKLATVSDVVEGTIVIVPTEKIFRDEVCFVDFENDKLYLKNNVEVVEVDANTYPSMKCLMTNKPGNVIRCEAGVFIEREDQVVDKLKAFERKLVRPDPEWISVLIQQNRPYKLPVFINTDVFEAIVADLIENEWGPPTMDLLDFTSELMDNAAEQFIKQIERMKSFPLMESFLVGKASETVGSLKKIATTKVQDFIKREKVPYLQNHYLFENLCKLRSERLMDEVLSSISGNYGNETISVHPSSLVSMIKNIFERNQKRSIDDHMVEEMQNALNSYGKVALKRFIDNVPMICVEIMQNFADELNDALSEITDEEINRIVVAPSGVIQKRDKLKRKCDVLEKGILALVDLY